MTSIKKNLRKFYEEEAKLMDHQELMYAKGPKHELWWHRKRLNYVIHSIEKTFGNPKIMTFADIGCAEGYYVKRVASLRDDVLCVGADISKNYIIKAKRKTCSKKPNIDFVLCDVSMLPFRKNIFDVILCSEVLEHVTDCNKALAELDNIAKKYLILSFPGHSLIYRFVTPIRAFKRLIDKIETSAGHISEVTMENLISVFKAHESITSLEIKLGGALPLQLYKIVPFIELVDAIDNLACKVVKHFNAHDLATIHVINASKSEYIVEEEGEIGC
jgi:2-polyprenyl-3-methyl-5-hydroxy-6-metoxy-1,4-benzoquinol methylase